MNEFENQFKEIVAGLNIDDRPNAEHKETLRQQMLAACKESSSKDTARRIQPTWRKIMKSNLTKSAAAAILIAAVLTGIYQITGSIDGATIAFADVIEAMKNVSWLHQTSKGFQGNISGTGEQWIGFKSNVHAAKWADEKKTFWDINEQKRYEYDPGQNCIIVADTTGTEIPFSIASPTAMLEGIHKMLVEQGAEVVIEPTEYNGRKVQLQRFSLSFTEQSQFLQLYIDPKSKLLLAAEITAKDAAGTVIMDGVAAFSYPATGPTSIYDLGVPKDMPIKAEGAILTGIESRISQIDQLETWPEPLELVQQYWDARNKRDYETTRLYWPNSEQWDEAIKEEAPTDYVFGQPYTVTTTSLNIPYDSQEHYNQTQEYRFVMVLSKKHSEKGRYYIVSGN